VIHTIDRGFDDVRCVFWSENGVQMIDVSCASNAEGVREWIDPRTLPFIAAIRLKAGMAGNVRRKTLPRLLNDGFRRFANLCRNAKAAIQDGRGDRRRAAKEMLVAVVG
jgi:hypothetical protein